MTDYSRRLVASAEGLGAWRSLPFFSEGISKVASKIEGADADVLPPAEEVFAALTAVEPEDARVVILGQDPYPTPGHAHGLAFSVRRDVSPLPRSLSNIFKEMADDVGVTPEHGQLSGWADQGVLLLNTALTVTAGDAGGHLKYGWAALAEQIVGDLADRDGIVWVLWGRHAQKFRPLINAGNGTETLVIESVHPSPLSARRGFFGSKPFSRINTHLEESGRDRIDWSA